MRLRFRTQVLNGWNQPEYGWLREVRRHAAFVWVRLAGLNAGTEERDHRRMIGWEQAASKMCPNSRTCAYLLVVFHGTTPFRGPDGRQFAGPALVRRGMGTPGAARARWGRSMVIAERVGVLLRLLQAEQPHPIGVFAEDFSARWLAESGFLPDLLVLDNPMVSLVEAQGRYAALFSRPGYVRRSRWPAMGEWDFWGMHFREEDLVGEAIGLPSRTRHTLWWTVGRAELDACRRERPILDPICRRLGGDANGLPVSPG